MAAYYKLRCPLARGIGYPGPGRLDEVQPISTAGSGRRERPKNHRGKCQPQHPPGKVREATKS